MKNLITLCLLMITFVSCKKNDADPNAPKKVTYYFNPGGSNAVATYRTISKGGYGSSAINIGFSVDDEVMIGDNAIIHMATEEIVGDFEIRIGYNGKMLAVDNTVEAEGSSNKVYIDHVFTEEDFK